jgi:hypothetical protein
MPDAARRRPCAGLSVPAAAAREVPTGHPLLPLIVLHRPLGKELELHPFKGLTHLHLASSGDSQDP